MKKLFIILLSIILVSCVDNELIIPDENTGNIDGIDTEEPIQKLDLKLYESDYPNAKFNIKIHDNNTIASVGSYKLTRKDGKIVSASKGSDRYQFTYNNNDIYQIINLNKHDTLFFSEGNQKFTAIKKYANGDEILYTFNKDTKDYFNGYKIKKDNDDNVRVSFAFTGENISQITYSEQEISKRKWTFVYESNTNPLRSMGIDDYNEMFLLMAFEDEIDLTPSLLQLCLLFNKNNIIQHAMDGDIVNINYTYRDTSQGSYLPINGVAKNGVNDSIGNVKYTYR